MPLISQRSVEDIRSRADIVALIGDYTNLTRSGSRWKGLSPFTAEKTPSFFVDPDKGFYYCFSTGQGGDVFKFLMTRENLTFPEAVERVAQRFGLPVEYESHGNAERSIRNELFEINKFAAHFFEEQFHANDPQAQAVRDYWKNNRGFSEATAREFSIGFLPKNASRRLIDWLRKKGFSEQSILASGMFGRSAEKAVSLQASRIQFEARLIIPIRDIQGRVIAFTARKIPGITPDTQWEEAKYKNSSESEVFKKGNTLFNIDKAKEVFTDRSQKDKGHNLRDIPFVLVEGQLDAIRCYENGIKTAVAGQGTSITLQQMQLLARYSNELNCLLDADAAGQKAAVRLAPLAFEAGLDLHFLSVPGGKDPDEFLSEHGAAGTDAIFATKRSAISFIAERYFGGNVALTPVQKQEALNEIYAILSSASSRVFRTECLWELARHSGLQRVDLERDFQRFENEKKARKLEREGVPASPAEGLSRTSLPLTTVEEDVLVFVFQYDALLNQLSNDIPAEWICSDTPAGRILNRIIAEYSEGNWKNAKDSLPAILEDDEERSYIAKLSMQARRFPAPEETARQCLARLCERYCAREQQKIDAAIARLPSGDPQLTVLFRRSIELRNTLKLYKK